MTERAVDTLRVELRALRDGLLQSIDGARLGDVEEGLDLYVRLIDGVLETRARLEKRFGFPSPASWFGEHGQEMQLLTDDLRSVVTRAWVRPDEAVLQKVITFMVGLLDTLRRSGRLAVHADVLSLARLFYFESLTKESHGVRRSIGSRLLSSVREYVDFFVLPTDVDVEDPELEVARQSVGFLVQSARRASQYRPDRATEAFEQIDELVDHFELRGRRLDRLDLIERDQPVLTFLGGYLLGLMADVIHREERDLLGTDAAVNVFREAETQLQRISVPRALLAALDSRGSDSPYPWASWEMESWPSGQRGGTIGHIEDRIRVVAALEMSRQPQSLGLFTTLAVDGGADSFLIKSVATAAETASANERLLRVLPDPTDATRRLATIASELTREADRLAELERDQRALIEINPEKIRQFTDAVMEAWNKPGLLRGDLSATASEPTPASWFGFNSLVPRDYFVDSDVYADPASLGETVGRGMERGEVEAVLGVLDGLRDTEASMEDLPSVVSEELERQQALGLAPAVVVVNSWRAHRALTGDSGLGTASPVLLGAAPVLLEHSDDARSRCVVADLEQAVRIRRWVVRQPPADFIALQDVLVFSVRAIDNELAAELLASNPRLATDDDGQPVNESESIRRLKRQVHVRVWTKVEVESGDGTGEGLVVRVADEA
jgi:hypothetical protein